MEFNHGEENKNIFVADNYHVDVEVFFLSGKENANECFRGKISWELSVCFASKLSSSSRELAQICTKLILMQFSNVRSPITDVISFFLIWISI